MGVHRVITQPGLQFGCPFLQRLEHRSLYSQGSCISDGMMRASHHPARSSESSLGSVVAAAAKPLAVGLTSSSSFYVQKGFRLSGTYHGLSLNYDIPSLKSLTRGVDLKSQSLLQGSAPIGTNTKRVPHKVQALSEQGGASNMDATQMDAKQTVLSKLFDSSHFFVLPAYQRPYSWQKEHTDQLLSDLLEAASQGDIKIW